MLEHNQFQLKPGPYQHHKNRKIYVVETIVTHMENYETHTMEEQADPLVVYRDLEAQYQDFTGVKKQVVKCYARRLSEFIEEIDGVPRFTPI